MIAAGEYLGGYGMTSTMWARAAVARRLGGCSVLALLVAPHAAVAACSPNPTQDYATTFCTGAETAGLVVATSGSVNVAAGATVRAPAEIDAVTVRPGGATPYGLYTSLSVAGTVDGGTASGISLTTGALQPYGTASAFLTVASGGIVTGTTGLLITADPAIPFATATFSVDNSGTITGTNGVALSGPANLRAAFTTVNNHAGAVLGGINASVGTLTNRGTITGDVVISGPGPYISGSTVDTSGGGTIAGKLIFVRANSVLVADFGTAAAPIKGLAGTVSATGGGTNTLQLQVTADTTLTSPVTAPAGFTVVGFGIGHATLTLDPTFSGTAPILLFAGPAAGGTFVNAGQLTTVGAAIDSSFAAAGFYGYPAAAIVNRGTVQSAFGLGGSDNVGIRAGSGGLTNSGTITVTGGGGVAVVNGAASGNSGTITAAQTGVAVTSTSFANSGKIASTAGIGLDANGSGDVLTNSGTISGQTAGVRLASEVLVNTGTVTSPTLAVQLNSGTLDNRAGGIVTGGVQCF